MTPENVGIAALTILCGSFVLCILTIEIKSAYKRWRKRKSPAVKRSLYE